MLRWFVTKNTTAQALTLVSLAGLATKETPTAVVTLLPSLLPGDFAQSRIKALPATALMGRLAGVVLGA